VAQIFISYSHQDLRQARSIATELEARGWSVWWDPEIRSGESFIVLINREISAASCVVVLWSKNSVTSRWVMEEAHNALTRDIICPVMVEPDSQLPVGFATIKYVPLWEWRGDAPVGGFDPLVDELERIVGAPARPARRETSVAAPDAVEASEPAPPATSKPSGALRPERAAPPSSLPEGRVSSRRTYVNFSDLGWLDYVVAAAFVAALAALFASVLARFVLNQPSPFLQEMALVMIGLSALFGAAMAERGGRQIVSPVSALLFRRKGRRAMSVLHGIAGAGLFGFTTYHLFRKALLSLRTEEASGLFTSGLPQWAVNSAATVAFGLLTLFALRSILGAIRRRTVP
jgi:TRAP-type C4-dicarboxylate transport system permease small subunit